MIQSTNIYSYKSNFNNLNHKNSINFSGLGSTALKNVCANPKAQKRLNTYLQWYFDAYPNQFKIFMSDLNKLSGSTDSFAFEALRKRYESFSHLPDVLNKLNLAESMRSGQVIAAISDSLKKVCHRPSSILDVGCGNGEILKGLKDSYRLPYSKLTGVDVYQDTNRVPFNRLKYDGVNLARSISDAAQSNLDISKNYDTAILASVLHHSDDHLNLLKEVNKVMDKNGVLIVEDISPDVGFDDFHTVMDNFISIFQKSEGSKIPANYLSFDSLKDLAAKSGFAVKDVNVYMPDVLKQFVAVLQKI